jgi:hypothetical protein
MEETLQQERKPQRFAAVIFISPHQESCKRAVSTVLGAPDYFSEVHIVSPTNLTNEALLYRDWKKDKKQLIRDLHIPVTIHCSSSETGGEGYGDDADNCKFPSCYQFPVGANASKGMKDVRGHVICRIPPLVRASRAAIQRLWARVEHNAKTGQQRHAIMPIYQLETTATTTTTRGSRRMDQVDRYWSK